MEFKRSWIEMISTLIYINISNCTVKIRKNCVRIVSLRLYIVVLFYAVCVCVCMHNTHLFRDKGSINLSQRRVGNTDKHNSVESNKNKDTDVYIYIELHIIYRISLVNSRQFIFIPEHNLKVNKRMKCVINIASAISMRVKTLGLLDSKQNYIKINLSRSPCRALSSL